jgi:signal peptidase I
VSIWDRLDLLIFRSPRTGRLRIGTSPGAMRGRRIAFGIVLFALLASLGAAVVWWMTGGHLFAMTTPSMSPLIPVGALMATQQAVFPLHVGEIVAFRPPLMGGQIFVHKIYAISVSHGQVLYRTKGVLNSSPDSWFITRHNVIGKVVWWGDGLGWGLRCLPWFTLSFVIIFGFFRWMKVMDSVAFFAALDYALYVTLIIVNPLVHVEILALVQNSHHSASAWIVNTGVLDIRLKYNGAYHLLQAGHATSFTAVGSNIVRNGKIFIPGTSVLRWWQLLIEIFLIGAPIVAILVSRFYRRASAEEIAEWETQKRSATAEAAVPPNTALDATAAGITGIAGRRLQAPGSAAAVPAAAAAANGMAPAGLAPPARTVRANGAEYVSTSATTVVTSPAIVAAPVSAVSPAIAPAAPIAPAPLTAAAFAIAAAPATATTLTIQEAPAILATPVVAAAPKEAAPGGPSVTTGKADRAAQAPAKKAAVPRRIAVPREAARAETPAPVGKAAQAAKVAAASRELATNNVRAATNVVLATAVEKAEPGTKAAPAKKAAAPKKAAPAKKPAAKKPAATKRPAPAKKAAPATKAAPAKKAAPATKPAATKRPAPAKKAAPATKRAAPATKTAAVPRKAAVATKGTIAGKEAVPRTANAREESHPARKAILARRVADATKLAPTSRP